MLPTGGGCNQGNTHAYPVVVDVSGDVTRMVVYWSGFASGSSAMGWDGLWYGSIGPVPYSGKANAGGTLSIWVTAWNAKGGSTTLKGTSINVLKCAA
ncbi:MAG TPA: hypothetical protein VF163_08410 [Micromonosporaceae bacterium]